MDIKDDLALICHKKPDSDTLGSALALSLGLSSCGKKTSVYASDPIPRNLTFLPLAEQVRCFKTLKQKRHEFAVCLDCGDYGQTGLRPVYEDKHPFSIFVNVDHHGNEDFADLNIIDTRASSTAEIIYALLLRFNIEITKEIATCLLAGIIGDTDNFKNPNTTLKTYKATSSLMRKGANLNKLGKSLNRNKSFSGLKLWGKVLARVKKHPEFGIVSAFITRKEIDEAGCLSDDIEGIANFLNSIPEAKASLLLTEEKNGDLKGSFRTLLPEVDVAKIAKFFGGGGHRKAAGFTFPGRIVFKENSWKIV